MTPLPLTSPHGLGPPSDWVLRFTHAQAAPLRVLDLACGSGRHVRTLAAAGHHVTAVDRDGAALTGLSGIARTVLADLEGAAWPLDGERFDLVIVTNYLWRALLPQVVASVAPDGCLLYETFGLGHARFGRPSNPDFLLRPGELIRAVAGELTLVAYEDGVLDGPPRWVQRIAACRPASAGHAGDATEPSRWQRL
ncbi:MAG: class I SAM-dependent methyltransferase [Leptothrix sp. (in: b-proteobacteria)]